MGNMAVTWWILAFLCSTTYGQILKLSPLSLLLSSWLYAPNRPCHWKTAQYKMVSHTINVPTRMETTVRGLISLLVLQFHSYLSCCSVQTLTAPGGNNDALEIAVAIA